MRRPRRRTIEERGRTIPLEWLDPVAAVNTEVAVGTLVLILIGLTAMVWGAAELSSWWVNGSRAGVGGQEAVLAMVRLGIHKLRWEGAFSPQTERVLPGARAFWFAFAAEGLVLALLFWPVWRVMGPRPGDPMPVYIYPTPPRHPRNERRKARRASASASPGPAGGGGGSGGSSGGGPSGGSGAGGSGGGGGGPSGGGDDGGGDGPRGWGDPPPERLRVQEPNGRRLILGQRRD